MFSTCPHHLIFAANKMRNTTPAKCLIIFQIISRINYISILVITFPKANMSPCLILASHANMTFIDSNKRTLTEFTDEKNTGISVFMPIENGGWRAF